MKCRGLNRAGSAICIKGNVGKFFIHSKVHVVRTFTKIEP